MIILPTHFEPPRVAALQGFTLHVLSPRYSDQDFTAVCASAEAIRFVFGPENSWPNAGITHEENNADLIRHEREFNEKSAFAYALLDPSGARYLGCLYLKPIKSKTGRDERHVRFSAQAFLWMSSLHQVVSEEAAQAAIAKWFTTKWGLACVAWPGRNQSWPEWKALATMPASAV